MAERRHPNPHTKPPRAEKAKFRAGLVRRGVPVGLAKQLSREDDDDATVADIETVVIAWAKGLPKGRTV